ncbi:hypothetical protein ACL02U_05735 [Streptomyces sp. MS06]|uniref:hypothetical protein n=1 Tax=Streptomyces sp. MS06 TaxID=3385974 RepID=UPI0039A259A8
MSEVAEADVRTRKTRARFPVALALGIGCYAIAVIAGMALLSDDAGPPLQGLLWIVHGVLLIALIRKLGARESSTYTALFIVLASAMAAHVVDLARDDLTLQQRGERITVTVVKERLDPAQGRRARQAHYTLLRRDGSRVPGPEMAPPSDLYHVGQVLTVIADPEGELAPETPGQADATGEVLGCGAFALAALGAVGWIAWRGSDAARRRDARRQRGGTRQVHRTGTGDHPTRKEQEARLREVLGTHLADGRGCIEVHAGDYPGLSHERAARIAWETGLCAEAVGDQGSWRFGETVVEEAPRD